MAVNPFKTVNNVDHTVNSAGSTNMCWPAISSMSLGCASMHDFRSKALQASMHGFRAFEISFPDLETLARQTYCSTEPPALYAAADSMYQTCAEAGLDVMCLQPFGQYEGLRDRAQHAARIEKAKVWFELAHRLHTDLIAVPASFLDQSDITNDIDVIVADMTELADLGAAEGLRFSFEALAWSTYLDTWEQTWDVVQRVGRANFGLCLDTFNIAGRVYADPTAPTGKTATADADLHTSLARLASTVDVGKIFYVQVVDGERLQTPLTPAHPYWNVQQPHRMMWSRSGRLFYGEKGRGAYLPVRDILDVILRKLGYRGWLSMEYFNSDLGDEAADVPAKNARRARDAYYKIRQEFLLPVLADKT